MADSTNVVNLLQPDTDAMLRHLEHLFGGFLDGCHDGLIELAWTNTGDGKLKHAELYSVENLEEIATQAARANAIPNQNVYIGAALRKPGTPPFGRGQKNDFYASTACFVDIDDEGAADAVTGKYRGCKPTLAVVTGRQPYKRVQLWWRLETPERDPEAYEAQERGLVAALGGDNAVWNCDRVMRLGGSIAWPRKDGRVIEKTEVIPFADGRPLVMLPGQLAKAYPPIAVEAWRAQETAGAPQAGIQPSQAREPTRSPLTGRLRPSALIGAMQRGEQWHNNMIRLVAHWVGRGLSDAEILATAGSLTLQGWTERQTVAEMQQAIRGARAKWAKPDVEAEFDSETGEVLQPGESRAAVEILTLAQIRQLQPPAYVVDGLLTEHGFSLLYGAPRAFKSFLALDWLLCMAYGLPWCAREVLPKNVLYIAGEGVGGMSKRVQAWQIKKDLLETPAPFHMLRRGINFTQKEDVERLTSAVDRFVAATNLQIEYICVDTVARAMVGADESGSTDMGVFIAACDALRYKWNCGLLAVHHTGKNKELGARGSSALPAAVDTELYVERAENSDRMTLSVTKQKDDEEVQDTHLEGVVVTLPSVGIKPVTSLVLEPSQPAQEVQGGKLSTGQVNEMLKEVNRAWDEGKAWANTTQSKKDGRWLPRWMSEQFSITTREAEGYVSELLFNKFLDVQMSDKHTKRMGLRALKYLP